MANYYKSLNIKDSIDIRIQFLHSHGFGTYKIAKYIPYTKRTVQVRLIRMGLKNQPEKQDQTPRLNTCIICGKQFRPRVWIDGKPVGNLYRETCSDECYQIHRSNVSKEGWNDDRKKRMSELFTGRDTTGWNVAKGDRKPNWKGGKSPRAYRRIAFEEYKMPKVCERCGSTKNLNVHHRDRNRSNNTRENLMILCERCHTTYHNNNGDIGWKLYNKVNNLQKIFDSDLPIIKKRKENGETYQQIANDYNVSKDTIRHRLKKYIKQQKTLDNFY